MAATRHSVAPISRPRRYMHCLGENIFAALPTADRYPNSRIRQDLHLVGARRVELRTSSLSGPLSTEIRAVPVLRPPFYALNDLFAVLYRSMLWCTAAPAIQNHANRRTADYPDE